MNEIINQWEKAAEQFTIYQNNSIYARINKKIVKDRFHKMKGEKVLDLGCGYGYYTYFFNSIGAHAIGIDGSEASVDN